MCLSVPHKGAANIKKMESKAHNNDNGEKVVVIVNLLVFNLITCLGLFFFLNTKCFTNLHVILAQGPGESSL